MLHNIFSFHTHCACIICVASVQELPLALHCDVVYTLLYERVFYADFSSSSKIISYWEKRLLTALQKTILCILPTVQPAVYTHAQGGL